MYNELYDIWRTEKEEEYQLQLIPKDFYAKMADYIKKLKLENRMLDKKTTKAKLLQNEFQNVTIMIKQLFDLRQKKFLKGVFISEKISRDVLSEEEKKLYNDFSSSAEACHDFSSNILRGHLSKIEKSEKQATVVLRFIQKTPAIVGADMKTYGPFGLEDLSDLGDFRRAPLKSDQILSVWLQYFPTNDVYIKILLG